MLSDKFCISHFSDPVKSEIPMNVQEGHLGNDRKVRCLARLVSSPILSIQIRFVREFGQFSSILSRVSTAKRINKFVHRRQHGSVKLDMRFCEHSERVQGVYYAGYFTKRVTRSFIFIYHEWFFTK